MTIIDVIKREAGEIEHEAALMARANSIGNRKWRKINYWIGLPTTILAAASGAGTLGYAENQLADWVPMITAILALSAASLSAINTFIDPSERASAHNSARVAFDEIRRDANLLKDFETEIADEQREVDIKDLGTTLKSLNAKLSSATTSMPSIPSKHIEKARVQLVLTASR